jgi:hypothetical protein
MKLKLDANGNVVLQDGKPVYVHDDGKEVAFDAPATVQTISRLNAEAKTHRERAEGAEGKLKLFEGIEDPTAAKRALDTIKNLDQKKLVDAGEVEKVKAEAIKALQDQHAPVLAERDRLKADLYAEKIGGSFSRSKTIAEKFAIPADLVQARFGQNFKIEEGKAVAYDQSGNKIYSRARPGEVADFEEALEVLVDAYPYKTSILKGSGASGSGAGGSGNQGAGGKKTITRAQYDALPQAQQAAMAVAAGRGEATITD